MFVLTLGTGSTHDSAVLQRTSLLNHPEWYFQDDSAYIIGDSAYRLSNWVIRPFSRAVLATSEDGSERQFNALLSSARVNVEHTIGLVKLRFPLLRRLSFVLGEEDGNQRAINAVRAMCVLHNYLLDQQDQWELSGVEKQALVRDLDDAYQNIITSSWMDYMTGGDDMVQDRRGLKEAGERKRDYLKHQVLAWRGTGSHARHAFWWRN